MFSVYCYTNKVNGLKYIGITQQDPKSRWLNGRGYHNNKKFSEAINQFGWCNFQHEILADNLSEHEAVELEQALIKRLNTVKNGYNNSYGGKYVSKRALCHEANLIKQGLKAHPLLKDWLELFESAEESGSDSNLCQNLNIHCTEIVKTMKRQGECIAYGDFFWLCKFISEMQYNAKLIQKCYSDGRRN